MLRRINEVCINKNKYVLNPIIEWTDAEVWEYIRTNKLPYNPLYNRGFKRVGCIGCPMNTRSKKELLQVPRYMALYKKAAAHYLREHPTKYKTVEELFEWWFRK